MIAAALALLWWQYRGASAEDSAPPTLARVSSRGLTVRPGQGGWRITWDNNSDAARAAVRGVLHITEDEARESIRLTAEQVRAGAANYRPTGDDITFRLDLVAPDNSLATESYRVLMKPEIAGRKTQPAPAPPKPSPAPPAEKKAESRPEPPKPDQPKKEPDAETAANDVEPEVLRRVAPEIPEGIRPRITSPLAIDVKVSIDREGHVTRATAVQHEDGLVDFLGKRAVAAARQWTFSPARRRGKPVESSRTIHFVFEQ
jgi:outer membrane biosynthesis protein TonB